MVCLKGLGVLLKMGTWVGFVVGDLTDIVEKVRAVAWEQQQLLLPGRTVGAGGDGGGHGCRRWRRQER